MTDRRVTAIVAPWLARGPAPGLRRPRLLAAGVAEDSLRRVAVELGIDVADVPLGGGLPVDAVDLGMSAVDTAVDSGADLLVITAADTAGPAAVTVLAALTGVEPVAVVGFGGWGALAESAAQWSERVVAVRDGLRGLSADADGSAELLDGLATGPTDVAEGVPALAAAVGMVRAGTRRATPMIVDGLVAAVAALLASRDEADVRGLLMTASAPQTSPERLVGSRLGVSWLLDMGTAAPVGLAGLLAVPFLRGVRAYAEGA